MEPMPRSRRPWTIRPRFRPDGDVQLDRAGDLSVARHQQERVTFAVTPRLEIDHGRRDGDALRLDEAHAPDADRVAVHPHGEPVAHTVLGLVDRIDGKAAGARRVA